MASNARKSSWCLALAAAALIALPSAASAQRFSASTVQSPPNPVPAGTAVTYTTTVTNTDTEAWPPPISPFPNVFVSMYLTVYGSESRATPNTYQSVTTTQGACTPDATTTPPSVNCPIGSLAPNASSTYTATVVGLVSMSSHPAVVACTSVNDCDSLANADIDTIVLQPCIVPDVRNRTLPSAKRRLAKANCALGRVKKKHAPRRKRGRVVVQKPAPGTKLPNGANVALFLGKP